MAVKMNLTIITKNHTADPLIRFLAKPTSKSNGCATADSVGVKLFLIMEILFYTNSDFLFEVMEILKILRKTLRLSLSPTEFMFTR